MLKFSSKKFKSTGAIASSLDAVSLLAICQKTKTFQRGEEVPVHVAENSVENVTLC